MIKHFTNYTLSLKKSTLFLIPTLLVLFSINIGCYSLNGSSLDPSIKTIQIAKFPNYAPLQNTTLSQNFTNDLRDRYQQRTPLNVVESNGDLTISGEIVGYQESFTSVTSDEVAQQNRLTVKIKVVFTNTLDESKNFTKTFQDYEDYSGTQTLTQVESTIVPDITERIIDQIYNATVTDW